MNSLNLERHNLFQNENVTKGHASFAHRPLVLKLQQEF